MPGIKEWLAKAFSDLQASKKLSADSITFDCSVFHTHQCAEKALKAFIISIQEKVPKTHDLNFLLAFCVKKDSDFVFLFHESKSLDEYGENSRYPNDEFYIDQNLLEQAIKDAEKVFTVVQNKISKK